MAAGDAEDEEDAADSALAGFLRAHDLGPEASSSSEDETDRAPERLPVDAAESRESASCAAESALAKHRTLSQDDLVKALRAELSATREPRAARAGFLLERFRTRPARELRRGLPDRETRRATAT